MIESKQFTWRTSQNVGIPHNEILVVQKQGVGALNMFQSSQGTDEPMGVGGSRIGDQISVRGVMIRAFFENSLQRNRVYYRLMVVKCAKGDVPSNTTLFKGDSVNRMIDQVNNERYTIIAQKIFNITGQVGVASSVTTAGEPQIDSTLRIAAQGTKTLKMWIPGSKFGRMGNVQYENGSQTQVKFYDYRIVLLAYDWYGTPETILGVTNQVGRINELYTKVYFKDA